MLSIPDQADRRLAVNQTGKRQCVIIIRARDGRSVPAVFRSEGHALDFIRAPIAKGSIVRVDEASSWDALHKNDACTNDAESYFSRLRRAEIGHHHHVAGVYLLRYAQEASWREDHRRMSNGEQVERLAAL